VHVVRCVAFALVSVALGLALAPSSRADEPLGVMDRDRPDYDAKGIPLGAFRLRPSLDVDAVADDNVFRTETAKNSDVFFAIAPALDLKSDWGEHSLEFAAGLTRYQYLKLSSQDRTDWHAGLKGRLDVLRGSFVDGDVSYNVLHEPCYSPNEPGCGTARPTQYALFHSALAATYQPDRFGISIGGFFDRYDYTATPLVGGGHIDNGDRNRDQFNGFVKLSYEISPGFAVFARGAYDRALYDEQFDSNGFDRNSTAYHADAGATFFATHLIQGEVFAGYVKENFVKPFGDVSGLDYGAAIHWYATPLMTFHFTASRSFNDTTVFGASSSDDQGLGTALDYELLRNLIIQTHVNYTDSRFEGISRDDKIIEAAFNAKYLLNRYMSANAGYVFTRRSSSAPGQDYTDNAVMAGLHFQL